MSEEKPIEEQPAPQQQEAPSNAEANTETKTDPVEADKTTEVESAKPDETAKPDTDRPSTQSKDYPGGERFDPSNLPKSEDAAEMRKQVEFYFSDSNLPHDKYLFTMISENDGWADLRAVTSFKRMKRFQPYTAVVAALRESTFLDVDEAGERIKRKIELRPFSGANVPVQRSVYVKGFPPETKTMQIDLEKFFEQFGEIRVVRLRRTDEGLFKGSVFVEFATVDEQSGFLKLWQTEEGSSSDAAPKYEDAALEVMSKSAYMESKEKQYGGKFPGGSSSHGKRQFNAFARKREEERGSRGGRGGRDDRGRGRGRGGRGGRGGGRGNGRNDRNAEREAAEGKSVQKEPEAGEKRAAPESDSHDVSTEASTKKAKTDADE